MRGKKLEFGYIKKQRIWTALIVAAHILIAIGIFLFGYLLNHGVRTNIFTILSILVLLPAAKHIVMLVTLLSFAPPKGSEYDQLKEALPPTCQLFAEFIVAAPEKTMLLSYMIVEKGNILAMLENDNQNDKIIVDYLAYKLWDNWPEYTVQLVKDVDAMVKSYNTLSEQGVSEESRQEVLALLRILAK